MNLYVETNFVLELAFLQQQAGSCDEILKLCESGRATLVVPAWSIAEASAALRSRTTKRFDLAKSLDEEFKQLGRSEFHSTRLQEFREMTTLLVESIDMEASLLSEITSRVLQVAQVVPLDSKILRTGQAFQDAFDLRLPDALVLASVFDHLGDEPESPSWFANRDSHFKNPKIVQELTLRRCKLVGRFDHALAALRGESLEE